MWPYWLLTALLVLQCVCLGILGHQRDKARTAADTYRAALAHVDPDEARRLTIALQVGLQ